MLSNKLDFIFNKMIPKKFLVWVVATVLVFMKILPGDLWAYLSMVYLGVNVIQKGTDIFKKQPEKPEPEPEVEPEKRIGFEG